MMRTETKKNVQAAFRALAKAKSNLGYVARVLHSSAYGITGEDVEEAITNYVGALAELNDVECALKMICDPEVA